MKKNLFLLVFVGGLILAMRYYYLEAQRCEQLAQSYRQTSEALMQKIRRIYDEKYMLYEQNMALKQAAEQDKGCFNWHTDISNSPVIIRLQAK